MPSDILYKWGQTSRDLGQKSVPRRPSADRTRRGTRRGTTAGFDHMLSTFSLNSTERRRLRSAGTPLPGRQQGSSWARKWRNGVSPSPQPSVSTPTPQRGPDRSRETESQASAKPRRKVLGTLTTSKADTDTSTGVWSANNPPPSTLEREIVKCKKDLLDRSKVFKTADGQGQQGQGQGYKTIEGDKETPKHQEDTERRKELDQKIKEKQSSWVKENWKQQHDTQKQLRHAELLHIFKQKRMKEREEGFKEGLDDFIADLAIAEENREHERERDKEKNTNRKSDLPPRPKSASITRTESIVKEVLEEKDWFTSVKEVANTAVPVSQSELPSADTRALTPIEPHSPTDIQVGDLETQQRNAIQVQKLKTEGNAAYQCRKYAEAVQCYNKALKIDIWNATVHCNRAAAYLMLGYFDKCLTDCQAAIHVDPLYAKAHFRAGKALLLQYQPRAARRYYHTALQLVRQQNADRSDSELTGMEEKIDSDLKAVTFVEQCKNTADQGKWADALHYAELAGESVKEEALQQLRLWALTYVDPVMARVELGHMVSITQKQVDKTLVNNELGINPSTLSDQLTLLGRASFFSGHLYVSAAAQRLKEALKYSPDHKEATQLLRFVNSFEVNNREASANYRSGKWSEAYQYYTQCLHLDPANHRLKSVTFNNRAAALLMMGNPSEAIKDCTAAINEDCTNVKAYARRSHAYQDLGNLDAAVRDLELAAQLNPSYLSELREVQRKRDSLRSSSRPSSAAGSRPSSAGARRHHSQGSISNTNFINNFPAAASHTSSNNYYRIMGLDRNADAPTVMRKYKDLALKYHPDRCHNVDTRNLNEKLFKEIGEARTVLTDGKLRADYDLQLACNSLK